MSRFFPAIDKIRPGIHFPLNVFINTNFIFMQILKSTLQQYSLERQKLLPKTEQPKNNIVSLWEAFQTNILNNMGKYKDIEPGNEKYSQKFERKELEEYIKNIYVFTSDDYKYLKNKLQPEDFENVCISLVGGKSYNIFKMQDAGIKCPLTVPLTTNWYFDAIGPENQALIADIFQECGGEDDIHYPHNEYTSANIKSIGELIKDRIKNIKLSSKAEQAIRQAYDALGGFFMDKILRSATVSEDGIYASFAGCGDSNAQFIQLTPEEDYELFKFNAIAVAASAFNFVGIENKLGMTAENGANFSPRKDPMAITTMPFVYPENYAELSDDEIVSRVSAAYIFTDQIGNDGRKKITFQITNGTGATIADSGEGLPLVTFDTEVYRNMAAYNIDNRPKTTAENTLVFFARLKDDAESEPIEFYRVETPPQKTCMLINEDFDHTDLQSDRKKVVLIPEGCYSPATDPKLAFALLGIVDKIESIYPGQSMESEYAIIRDNDGNFDISCVQTRPITVTERKLVGEIPKIPEDIIEYVITTGKVYSTGARLVTVYRGDTNFPRNTEDFGPIAFYKKTIDQNDAEQYGQKNVVVFIEEVQTGKSTHAGVQAREHRMPCVSGVGTDLENGAKYYVFAYSDKNGYGLVVKENDATKAFIAELEEFHNIQVENAFNIAENLKNRPLKHFNLGINVSDAESAKAYGSDGLGFSRCPLFRANPTLALYYKGFDYINPEADPRFIYLLTHLENEVFEAASQFPESFNYRHAGPQLNEHFSNRNPAIDRIIKAEIKKFTESNPDLDNLTATMRDRILMALKKGGLISPDIAGNIKIGLDYEEEGIGLLIAKYGDDKFSLMQGATFTCQHPDFFEKVEIPMIKNVLERLKSESKKTKFKFTIEFPKSAKEVNTMLRMMEKADLHNYENLQVGPMIENVQMALDIKNIALGKFKPHQFTFSFATNDLGGLTQGIDRQKADGVPIVAMASANPNPMLEIIQIATGQIKKWFPEASVSICGEIATNLNAYVLGILYNLGITDFAMPSDPQTFGDIFEKLHLYESRINPKTGKIDLPPQVRLNLTNPELVEMS